MIYIIILFGVIVLPVLFFHWLEVRNKFLEARKAEEELWQRLKEHEKRLRPK